MVQGPFLFSLNPTLLWAISSSVVGIDTLENVVANVPWNLKKTGVRSKIGKIT